MVVANTFATDIRVRREAKSLAGHGFEVDVLCWDRQGQRPRTESIDQCLVRNVRFGKTTVLASSRVYYLVADVVFQATVFLWIVNQIRRVRTLVIHSHDFNTLPACVAVRVLFKDRVRLVYDCHELTPGVYQEWYGSSVSRIVTRLERMALSVADAIITANDAILRYLRRKTSTRSVAIYSCPVITEVPRIQSIDAKKRLGLSGFFVVLFSGWVRQDYDFDMMWDTARYLNRNNVLDVKFVFIGPTETMRPLINAATHEGLQGLFDFRGWVSNEELLMYYVASDLCFAVTRDLGPNTRVLTPIKLFESMACGVPVVVREGTLAAEIVRRWGCGITIDPAQDSFPDELLRLKRNTGELHILGEASRKPFRLVYNWDLMEVRLLRLYDELRSTYDLPDWRSVRRPALTAHERPES